MDGFKGAFVKEKQIKLLFILSSDYPEIFHPVWKKHLSCELEAI